MSDKGFKWADVAHYYTKSGITIQSKKYPQFKCEISHVKGMFLHGYSKSEGDIIWKLDECSPILRHLNDITAEEIKELHCAFFEYEHTDYAGNKIRARSADIREHEGLLAATRIVKGYNYKRAANLNYYPNDGRSGEISETFSGLERGIWLIKRGFDMFGLIESGQAIRKEVKDEN